MGAVRRLRLRLAGAPLRRGELGMTDDCLADRPDQISQRVGGPVELTPRDRVDAGPRASFKVRFRVGQSFGSGRPAAQTSSSHHSANESQCHLLSQTAQIHRDESLCGGDGGSHRCQTRRRRRSESKSDHHASYHEKRRGSDQRQRLTDLTAQLLILVMLSLVGTSHGTALPKPGSLQAAHLRREPFVGDRPRVFLSWLANQWSPIGHRTMSQHRRSPDPAMDQEPTGARIWSTRALLASSEKDRGGVRYAARRGERSLDVLDPPN